MSWTQLLATRKVHKHRTSKQELDELRSIVARDIKDAAIPTLSEDRKFATAPIHSKFFASGTETKTSPSIPTIFLKKPN